MSMIVTALGSLVSEPTSASSTESFPAPTEKPSDELENWKTEKETMQKDIVALVKVVELLKNQLNETDHFTNNIESLRDAQLKEQEIVFLDSLAIKEEELKTCQISLKREDESRRENEQRVIEVLREFREMRKEDAAERKMEREIRQMEMKLVQGFIEAMRTKSEQLDQPSPSSSLGLL